ncbi:hypothetical protein [Ruegeria arenilitoris]|uniref:hypothetical protein n=1 Tax=Ruegeria arenilitoris TaxID=1173585 RepID=UPI00147B405A|nr:hypothetical protein [Ruegeria arenilitoris]
MSLEFSWVILGNVSLTITALPSIQNCCSAFGRVAYLDIERPHSAFNFQPRPDAARTQIAEIARSATQNTKSTRRAIAQPVSIGLNTNTAPIGAG